MPSRARTRVKICGCTGPGDVALAVDAGADAVGMIFAESSPRRIGMESARAIAAAVPAFVTLVAVFTDPPVSLVDEALRLGAIPQFHGHEPAEVCEGSAPGPYLKALHLATDRAYDEDDIDEMAAPYEHATLLFDTRIGAMLGGTGRAFAWDLVAPIARRRPIVVSGGLTPENVGDCIRAVRPYAVDVRGGVETDGVKDPERVHAFVRAVRAADAALETTLA